MFQMTNRGADNAVPQTSKNYQSNIWNSEEKVSTKISAKWDAKRQNVGQNHSLSIDNKSFENVASSDIWEGHAFTKKLRAD
jgi:hypothetical protein